ncbi:hypothetical protein EVA_13684 [gut metagenome]|uniref:Uncharacterized protein n=1 Tax=gut metagenome TaxID=749906 RepID=J9G8W4_9ZZZZ
MHTDKGTYSLNTMAQPAGYSGQVASEGKNLVFENGVLTRVE